jgi:hypothetical protein
VPFQIGDAWDDSDSCSDGTKHGWMIGDRRVVDSVGLRRSNAVRVKWFRHKQGDSSRPARLPDGLQEYSLAIVVEGIFRIHLREPAGPWEIHDLGAGQYALWGPGVEHISESPADCSVVTVRWDEADETKTKP